MLTLRLIHQLFQHTAARRRLAQYGVGILIFRFVSTHSRPKAAGQSINSFSLTVLVSTHSRPKAAGLTTHTARQGRTFQHTAARRRLANTLTEAFETGSFNTQPPEGGWKAMKLWRETKGKFQHTAARRRLAKTTLLIVCLLSFQHTAARRRLVSDDGF